MQRRFRLGMVATDATRPELVRLAEATRRQSQAHLRLLQTWLDRRGLSPASSPWRSPRAES